MGWSDEGPEGGSRGLDGADAFCHETMAAWHARRVAVRSSALDADVHALAHELEEHSNLVQELEHSASLTDAALRHDLVGGATTPPVSSNDDLRSSITYHDDEDHRPGHQHRLLGKQVRIRGLQSMAALNGRLGMVVGFDNAKARFRVRLDDDETGAKARVMAFKESNLDVLRIE
jgi:hypothetical protein